MARWKDLQFRSSRDTFPIVVIFSVIDFAENYTFSPQKEIQSQYYHSEQVSILVHVSYRHAKEHIDGIQSTVEQWIVIKEAHFYISGDSDHDKLLCNILSTYFLIPL